MFSLSLLFLVCQAILVVIWVDVPNWRESVLPVGETDLDLDALVPPSPPESIAMRRLQTITLGWMFLTWPIFVLESLYHWAIRPKVWSLRWFHLNTLMHAVCPSLRLAARSLEMDKRLWLPGWGWQRVEPRLRRRIERRLSIPMISIALLILPILLIEFVFKRQVAEYTWLRTILHIGTGVIWFAFAAEFIVMVSIAHKKIDYVKRHWIDLAIIALPLFSFLRGLSLFRTTRLAQLARFSKLSRLLKAYRLRGTALRVVRALVILRLFERLIQFSPERRLKRLQEKLAINRREQRMIRLEIARLKAEQQSENDEHTQSRSDDSQ